MVSSELGWKTSNWEKPTIKRHSTVIEMWSSYFTCTMNIKSASGAESDKIKTVKLTKQEEKNECNMQPVG